MYNTQSLANSIRNHEENIILSSLFVRDTIPGIYTIIYMYIIFDFLYEFSRRWRYALSGHYSLSHCSSSHIYRHTIIYI